MLQRTGLDRRPLSEPQKFDVDPEGGNGVGIGTMSKELFSQLDSMCVISCIILRTDRD